MNKANILSNINTKIENGGNSTALEVRQVLGTDANSLLETVYGDEIVDNNVLQVITTSNANFTYNITVFKNGNHITIYGQFGCQINTNNGQSTPIFTISNTDYQGKGIGLGKGFTNNTNVISINANPDGTITLEDAVLSGEVYSFSITFNSSN